MMYLDCTLRDGGYYTDWDFDPELVSTYLSAMEDLPVDVVEVGYRAPAGEIYTGEFFHLPRFRLEAIRRQLPSKKIAIMLNEVDTSVADLESLIDPVRDTIDIVRLAVKPENFDRAAVLAKAIQERGLEVAFNAMYLSDLIGNQEMFDRIADLDGCVEYLNLVDSYGGVFPADLANYVKRLRPRLKSTLLGYHGHNNLELAFANSMVAMEHGCDIVDGTVTGMGRGAGNLKTELWMTWLATQKQVPIDFNVLSTVTGEFEALQQTHQWGTKLAYMVAGARSLPQKLVMNWVSNRAYSLNSIVRALNNQNSGVADNEKLPVFQDEAKTDYALIVGGGPSVRQHLTVLHHLIKSFNGKICLIHASARNAQCFDDLDIPQYFCLVGNEGHRLEKVFENLNDFRGKCVLPPYPRKMGTYVPRSVRQAAFELNTISFTDQFKDSHTALALQTSLDLKANEVWIVGYDGYTGNLTHKEQDLFNENEYLFSSFAESHREGAFSLTPTRYQNLILTSAYGILLGEEINSQKADR